MAEHETEPAEEASAADTTGEDAAPGADASADADSSASAGASASDEEMAAAVDQRAEELTGEDAGAPGLAVSGAADPIAQAEEHIASLDMDEERQKVDDLTQQL